MIPLADQPSDHHVIMIRLFRALDAYVRGQGLGIAIPDGAQYRVTHPDGRSATAKPDVSFVTEDEETFAAEFPRPAAPPLVAEIVSRHDRYTEVEEKVAMWLHNGVRLVWVLDHNRRAAVHRSGQPTLRLGPDDPLLGLDVVPGFAVRLGDLYPATA
jgi:Uma2 family endonuclease